jgi:hypothetical protein
MKHTLPLIANLYKEYFTYITKRMSVLVKRIRNNIFKQKVTKMYYRNYLH